MAIALHNEKGPLKKPRGENLKKNMKIRRKDYLLRNLKTDESIVVSPPRSMRPGLNADGIDPRDTKGQWIRRFDIAEAKGVKTFNYKKQVMLVHLPGVKPHHRDARGRVWELEPIAGTASKNKKTRR